MFKLVVANEWKKNKPKEKTIASQAEAPTLHETYVDRMRIYIDELHCLLEVR